MAIGVGWMLRSFIVTPTCFPQIMKLGSNSSHQGDMSNFAGVGRGR